MIDRRSIFPKKASLLGARLSWMMFLQYFVMGSTLPILSLYFKDCLHFTGGQIGIIMSMSSIAALVAPLVGAFIADRVIDARSLLGICHLAAATVMGFLAFQSSFASVVLFYLIYVLVMGPTIPLTNAIVFHHFKNAGQNFGNIRVFGTLGWIAVSIGFGYLWLGGGIGGYAAADRLPDALKLSAISSAILGSYAFTLPCGVRKKSDPVHIVPVESARVLLKPQVLFLAVVSLVIGIVDRYYYFGAGPFLRHFGFTDGAIMPAMSLGQIVEVVAMGSLAFILRRLGIKLTLILGVLAEVWRFVALSMGTTKLVILSGIACHGIAYALFFTTVYITIDSHTDEKSRTGLHQLFSIITSGVGSVSASLLAGFCLDTFVIDAPQGSADYQMFWMIPATASALILFALVVFFRGARHAGRKENPDGCPS